MTGGTRRRAIHEICEGGDRSRAVETPPHLPAKKRGFADVDAIPRC